MSQVRPIEDLFAELVELTTAAERDAFLDKTCRADPDLRVQLEKLIAANEQVGSFLRDDQDIDPTADLELDSRLVGSTIGPYKLREQIGDGGMGVVYVAEQERPLRRKVALKVIKPGMDSKAVLARFDAERNALALMNHPSIAKVLDAGTTEQGHPYFVMELIQGKPITDYCDQKRLTIKARLELFTQICNAVQHAHQKGVIHRDIKPSNILVTEIDGKPVPKVIDFGVAKALGANLTDRTVYTSFQALVGTPLYMSPEQTQLSGVDVDTSSDVYSLGILLYELLTGTTPLSPEELRAAAQDEVLKRIRETEPPRPSNRISSLGESSSQVCECRGAQAEQLGRLVRGDLDWIVMKSLEKDRNRRYKTADALAADIARHLTSEPVEARPPSTAYRLSRFYRRNRGLVGVSGIVLLVIILATGAVTSAWLKAIHQEQLAKQRLERLQDTLFEQALLAAIIGDVSIEQFIEDAKAAGVQDQRIKLLEGVRDYHDGQDAIEPLKKAHDADPDDVLAKAMYAVASGHSGDQQTSSQLVDELKAVEVDVESQPLTALIRAYPMILEYPEEAKAVFDHVVKQHPSWFAARLFRTGSMAVIATETGDPSLIADAMKQAGMCEELAPESPFMWLVCLVTYQAALQFESDPYNQAALRRRALTLANKLKNRPKWHLGTDIRAKYLRYFEEDTSTAVEAYQAMLDTVTPTEIVHNFAAVSFQDSEESARAAIKIIQKNPSPWSQSAVAMLCALLGDRPSPVTPAEQDPYVVLNSCWAFLIFGDLDSAERTSGEFLQAVAVDQPTSWYARGGVGGQIVLEFLARPKKKDVDRILSDCEDISLLDAHMVRFTLALYLRASGEPEAAKRIIQDVISSGPFYSIPRSWAVALNERWSQLN